MTVDIGKIEAAATVKEFRVAEYCPPGQPDTPTELHLLFDIAGDGNYIAFRFRSPETLSELIVALIEHADNVFHPEFADMPTEAKLKNWQLMTHSLTLLNELAEEDDFDRRVLSVADALDEYSRCVDGED